MIMKMLKYFSVILIMFCTCCSTVSTRQRSVKRPFTGISRVDINHDVNNPYVITEPTIIKPTIIKPTIIKIP